MLPAGVVLTGGTSKMEGALDLAEEIFHMPVSLGKPKGVSGLNDIVGNPIYSTAVGLLLYGGRQQFERGKTDDVRMGGGMVRKFKTWLTGTYS